MKRILLIMTLSLFLPNLVSAQSSFMNDFFKRYETAEGFSSVSLGAKMMQTMSRQAAEHGDKGLAVLLAVKSELVMITYGAKETVVVNIYGVFDLKQIARLSSIRPQ